MIRGRSLFLLSPLLLLPVVGLTACQPGNLACDDPPRCTPWVLRSQDGGVLPPIVVQPKVVDAAPPVVTTDAAPNGSPADTGPPPVPPGERALVGCAAAKTVDEFEAKVMDTAEMCTGCHNPEFGASFAGVDLKSAKAFSRMIDQAPLKTCKSGLLINTKDPMKSVLLLKLQKMPLCPDGSPGGTQMPSSAGFADPGSLACFEAYVKALAAP